ncbi:MAG: hypothetical protein ACE37B_17115 [Ilumatobacter sp.]|jgi:hypothetical protein|uniref:hypothetical protein n=1 Tax=Ilumatobacter sp. TaxID=1967498 RepID=UPI00391DF11D
MTTSTITRVLPWIARLAWLAVVAGGAALEAAVDGRSDPVRWLVGIGGWTVWGTVLVALLIPSTLSLTWARVVAPLSLVAVVASIVGGADAVDVALLAMPSLVAVGALFTPEVGRWMVQASAYGDEDRLPLRTPVPAGTAAVVTWLVWSSSLLIGPLALAAGNLLAGLPLTIVAVAASVYVGPRWFRMAQRWLVLVPAGLVVHDPVVLADTVMVRSHQLIGIGLARVDTEAADLTGPASGYAVEVMTNETVTTVFAFTPKEPNGRAIHMTSFLVAPSRPGAALRRAAERGLPVT